MPRSRLCRGDALNRNEKALARVMRKFVVMSLEEAAAMAFPGMGKRGRTRGNSWVRNSLRKLCRYGMAERVERGVYRWRSGRPGEA